MISGLCLCVEVYSCPNNYCQQSPDFFSCCFPSKFDWLLLTRWRIRALVISFMQTQGAYRIVIFRCQILTLFLWIFESCKWENNADTHLMGLKNTFIPNTFLQCMLNKWSVQAMFCTGTCLALCAQSHTSQALLLKSLTTPHEENIPALELGMEDEHNSSTFCILTLLSF